MERDGELTDCPHCGRPTLTVGAGACAECWQAKPGGRGVIRDQEPRTERLFDLDDSWFGVFPGWRWLTLAGVVLTGIVGVVIRALLS
jgi:hypothetical protein